MDLFTCIIKCKSLEVVFSHSMDTTRCGIRSFEDESLVAFFERNGGSIKY